MAGELAQPIIKRPPLWQNLLNLVLLVGLVGVFAWQVYDNWGAIAAYDWTIDWGLAGLAFLLIFICLGADSLIWNRALGWFAPPLPYVRAVPVFIWATLARYIPGKVASLIVRVVLASQANRAAMPVLAASVIELALRMAAALLIFLVTLPGLTNTGGAAFLTIGIVFIVAALVGAHPRIAMPVMNWMLRKIKHPPLDHTLRYREVLGLFGLQLARWTVYGVAFALVMRAVHPPAAHDWLVLLGTGCGSYAFGFLAMTPGGLGIMEWVQKGVLATLGYPTALTLVLPVLARLFLLAAEGVWALIALTLWRVPVVDAPTIAVTAPQSEELS
jgi:uncharacterized membrane protein YbhN (UPF0104 family)